MIMKTTEMLAEEMPLTQRKEKLKKMADAYEGKNYRIREPYII